MQKYFGDILEKKAKVQERAQELMDAGEDFGDPSNYDEGDIVKVPAIINDKDFSILSLDHEKYKTIIKKQKTGPQN